MARQMYIKPKDIEMMGSPEEATSATTSATTVEGGPQVLTPTVAEVVS